MKDSELRAVIANIHTIKVKNGILIDEVATEKICYHCGRHEGINDEKLGRVFVTFKLNIGSCYGGSCTFHWVCDHCAIHSVSTLDSDAKIEMMTIHKKLWDKLKTKIERRKGETGEELRMRLIEERHSMSGYIGVRK